MVSDVLFDIYQSIWVPVITNFRKVNGIYDTDCLVKGVKQLRRYADSGTLTHFMHNFIRTRYHRL